MIARPLTPEVIREAGRLWRTAMNPDQMQRRIEAREKLSYEQRKLFALEEIADALMGIRSILVTMASNQPKWSS